MRHLLLTAVLLLAGCTSYIPFKDGLATPAPSTAPSSAWDRKAEACRRRGADMRLIEGAWHCIAR